MNTAAYRKNIRRLLIMVVLAALAAAAYMLVEVNFENQKLFAYAMKIRTPKLIAMLITAFAIGGASIVFQSVINNTSVRPDAVGHRVGDQRMIKIFHIHKRRMLLIRELRNTVIGKVFPV